MTFGTFGGRTRYTRPDDTTAMRFEQTDAGTSYLHLDLDRAGDTHDELLLVPAAAPDGMPLVVVHHGLLNDETVLFDAHFDDMREALLDGGYLLAMSSSNDDDWGNEGGIGRYLDVHDLARELFPQIGNTMLLGISMGGVAALAAARRQDMTDVVAWAGISPVCSLADQYADVASHQPYIEAAYPGWATTGTFDDTVTDGHDALNDFVGADYTGVAYRFYASVDDGTVVKANNSDPMHTMVSGAGATSSVVAGSGGHMDASVILPSDLVGFFDTYR